MAGSWLTSVSSKVLSPRLVTTLLCIMGKLNALFEITQLQPISCLPSFVACRAFHRDTNRIHYFLGQKASLWLRVMHCLSLHILSTYVPMHLPASIRLLAMPVKQLSLCVKVAACIHAS